MQGNKLTIEFNDKVVRQFMLASILWGIVGMLVGVLIATQLNFWQVNFGLSLTSFGRLRPLHTNAVIFAFVGNMMFAGIYYSTQRLVKARLASDFLSNLHFWGWQAIIVAAAVTLPLGLTRGKEYAELIWPINIAVTLIWVVFAVNFFWTLAKRHEKSLYVAVWFYIATIITVAMLYIVNHLSIPTSWVHSYPIFAGAQDGLVQWWYGHNAVAFFLTTPILGIMYYFLPKAAERPVYSYRLSVIHFWSLVFLYIWAGPHHLLNTALPNWLQLLGMTFSLMLWAPSWGGMLNGLLTLRGGWDKLRTDPVIKFFAAGVTFYGMATFEGPLLSIKSVNALGHYTDWIIGHVHGGALGWNGFMAAGMFYWMVPRLWNKPLHSQSLANLHFWLGTFGILLYMGAMWASGITQGLMLNATAEGGTILKYPNFLETVDAIRWLMGLRIVGGALYLVGFVVMAYNIWKSIAGARTVNGTMEVYVEAPTPEEKMTLAGSFFNPVTIYVTLATAAACVWMFTTGVLNLIALFATVITTLLALGHFQSRGKTWGDWYDRLLLNALPFTVLTFLSVAVGGLIQIIPMLTIDKQLQTEDRKADVYTPLELAGRDIYVREGCYVCHSQMIRTLVPDVMRYGDYSRLGESIWDHPYQWGSRRTGPDLARVGGKYNHAWHYDHMRDPRAISTGSNMPSYAWLLENDTDYAALNSKIKVQRTLGVPFPTWSDTMIQTLAKSQADEIARELQAQGRYVAPGKEIVALIAYLQSLGKKWTPSPTKVAASQ
jgi:cytochrome c oxidase cbb3-type subunit I/II